MLLECRVDAVVCVGRDENVFADVDPRSRTFLERDDRQPIEKVVEYLLALRAGLGRDAVANLAIGGQHAPAVADLRESSQATDGRSSAECLQIAVVDLGCQAGGPDLIEAWVLVDVD